MIETCLCLRVAPQRAVPTRDRRSAAQPARGRVGTYGSVHVRYGKAIRGGVPRRRRCWRAPSSTGRSMACANGSSRQGRSEPGDHPALWVTERLTRVSLSNGRAVQLVTGRSRVGPGVVAALPATFLCDASDRVRLPRAIRPRTGGSRLASTTAIYASVGNDFKNQTLRAALSRVYGKRDGEAPR